MDGGVGILTMIDDSLHHDGAVSLQVDLGQHVLGNQVGAILLHLAVSKLYLVHDCI